MNHTQSAVETSAEATQRALLQSYQDYMRWYDALQQAETADAVDVAIYGMNQAQARIRQYRRALEVS